MFVNKITFLHYNKSSFFKLRTKLLNGKIIILTSLLNSGKFDSRKNKNQYSLIIHNKFKISHRGYEFYFLKTKQL